MKHLLEYNEFVLLEADVALDLVDNINNDAEPNSNGGKFNNNISDHLKKHWGKYLLISSTVAATLIYYFLIRSKAKNVTSDITISKNVTSDIPSMEPIPRTNSSTAIVKVIDANKLQNTSKPIINDIKNDIESYKLLPAPQKVGWFKTFIEKLDNHLKNINIPGGNLKVTESLI